MKLNVIGFSFSQTHQPETRVNITVEEINPTRKKLVVTFTAAEVASEEKKTLQAFTREAALPGFRPGKSPVDLVRRKFGPRIKDETTQTLVRTAYQKALSDSGQKLYSVINVNANDLLSGKDESVEVTVDVIPAITLPDYKGLPLTSVAVAVKSEDVDAALEQIRSSRAEFSKTDGSASKGSYVKLTYTATLDGKPIDDLVKDRPIFGSQANTWEEAGGDESLGVAAVISTLVGLKAGDKTEVAQTYPSDFADVPALAGKTVAYAVEVHEVRDRVLPEVNEDFLKTLKVESVDQLRSNLARDIELRQKQEAANQHRQEISEALEKGLNFPLPESSIEAEVRQILSEIVQQNLRSGVSEEEVLKHRSEIEENAKTAAPSRVKLRFALLEIAEKESIKAEDKDFQSYIMNQAYATRRSPDQIVKELQNNREVLDQVRTAIVVGKTLDYLVSQGKVA